MTHAWSELRCDAMDRRSRVNDVAKNAGRKILCKAEKKVKSRLSKCMVDEANVVGSIDAIDRVRDCSGEAGCVLRCVLALAFGNR